MTPGRAYWGCKNGLKVAHATCSPCRQQRKKIKKGRGSKNMAHRQGVETCKKCLASTQQG